MPPALVIISRGLAVQRRGRKRALMWAGLASSIAVFFACTRDLDPSGPSFTLFCVSTVAALASAASLLRLRYNPAVSAPQKLLAEGRVRVEGGELVVQRGREIMSFPRDAIASGWLETQDDDPCVMLELRDSTLISVHTHSEADGEKLLRAAGVSAEQQVMRIRLDAPSQRGAAGCLAAAATVVLSLMAILSGAALFSAVLDVSRNHASYGAIWISTLLTIISLAFFYPLIAWVTPPLAIIGIDGVAIRGVGRRRFIPYHTIKDVTAGRDGVTLHFDDGRATLLPTHAPSGHAEISRPATALLERIRAARAAAGEAAVRSAGAQAAARALGREGRSFASFREHLRGLARATSGYREVSIASEDLAHVLEDVEAPPARRIAAALALSPVDDEHVKRRIRAALDACADDALRRVLEAAAEDALAEAELDRVERAERAQLHAEPE